MSQGVEPVSVLSLDLVHRDVQRPIRPLTHRQGFIDTELCSCHRLPLREGGEVEAELLPVGPRLQEVPLLLHCRHTNTHRSHTHTKVNTSCRFVVVFLTLNKCFQKITLKLKVFTAAALCLTSG